MAKQHILAKKLKFPLPLSVQVQVANRSFRALLLHHREGLMFTKGTQEYFNEVERNRERNRIKQQRRLIQEAQRRRERVKEQWREKKARLRQEVYGGKKLLPIDLLDAYIRRPPSSQFRIPVEQAERITNFDDLFEQQCRGNSFRDIAERIRESRL
jgi:hypothetical protein